VLHENLREPSRPTATEGFNYCDANPRNPHQAPQRRTAGHRLDAPQTVRDIDVLASKARNAARSLSVFSGLVLLSRAAFATSKWDGAFVGEDRRGPIGNDL